MSLKALEGIFNDKLFSFNPDKKHYFRGLSGSSLSFLLASIHKTHNRSCVLIASDKEKAAYFYNDLENLLSPGKLLFFPESYRQPYQPEKTLNANIQERAEVMSRISSDSFCGVVVTYPQALCEKVSLKKQLHQNTLLIKKEEKLSLEFIAEFLQSFHFEAVDFVYEPGQYSIRGGIVDIYSFSGELPYRIELFGNKVDAIKSFDPVTQLSEHRYDFVSILPDINSTLFTDEKALLTAYFEKENTLLFSRVVLFSHTMVATKFPRPNTSSINTLR